MFATSAFVDPRLLTFDTATGSLLTSDVITNEEALASLAFDGRALWAIDGFNDGYTDRTFRIDPVTAEGEAVGHTGFDWNFRSVEFDREGNILFGLSDDLYNNLFTIDRTSGEASPIATVTGPTLDQATALAINSARQAYVIDLGGTGLFELDLSTGNLTHLGDLNIGTWFSDLAFDEIDRLWGVDTNGDVYEIEIARVTAVFRFNAKFFLQGIAFPPPPIFCDGFESGDTSAWSVTIP